MLIAEYVLSPDGEGTRLRFTLEVPRPVVPRDLARLRAMLE
jgi:hypothetical protein